MSRTDAIIQNIPTTNIGGRCFKSLVLPLFRAKRGGEEEGQKLDPFELSRSHYGRMKSRVGCCVRSKKWRTEDLQQPLRHQLTNIVMLLL